MTNDATAVLDIEEKHFQLLSGRNYLVGSISDACGKVDIELQNQSLDAKHAIIRMCGDSLKIIDLHSRSGTFLNKCRLNAMEEVSIAGSATLQFGEIMGKLQLNMIGESHDSSGFHDGPKNTSDIISSSPEPTSQSRLKRSQTCSESAKNAKILDKSEISSSNFLVPSVPQRKSGLSNTSSQSFNMSATDRLSLNASVGGDKTTDSFFIPETQHCQLPNTSSNSSRNNESKDLSVNADNSRLESCQDDNDDDDYCIPETQDVVPLPSSQMRKRFRADQEMFDANIPVNIFAEDDEALGGSQFRICTQDFNDINCFGNSLDDSNSSDLLGDVPCSLIIPRVEHDPVILSESGRVLQNTKNPGDPGAQDVNETNEKEMSTLNWSECDSKCTAVTEPSQRDDTCTPDLFDLPELAKNNAVKVNNSNEPGKNIDGTCNSSPSTSNDNNEALANKTVDKASTNFEIPAASSFSHEKKLLQVTEPSLFEDDEDLLPTQVFASDSKEKKNGGGKCTPEYLTLSDKENMVPAVAELLETVDEMQPTQIFAVRPYLSISTSINNDRGNIPSFSIKDNSEPTAPMATNEHDDDFMLPTQVFPTTTKKLSPENNQKSSTSNEPLNDDDFMLPTQVFPTTSKKVLPKDNQLPSTSKCLSSTLIANDDRVKNAESFFADIERSTKKKTQIVPPNPVKSLTENNPSTSINNNSMSESPDIDFLLCTPQIVKQFEIDVKKDLCRKSKQKNLFGDDSEDDGDVVSHDFDSLLPHLKRQESPKRKHVEEHPDMRSIKNNKLNIAKKVPRNRDERHLLRDKVRETLDNQEIKDQKIEGPNKKESHKVSVTVDQSSDSKTNGRKRKTDDKRNAPTSKVTKQTEVNKSVPKKSFEKETEKRKASIEKEPKDIASDNTKRTSQKRNLRTKSNGQSEETVVELPPRRMTRLRSRTEEINVVDEPTNSEATDLKKKTRSRKRSDEKVKEKDSMDNEKNSKTTHSKSKDKVPKDLNNVDSSKNGIVSTTETRRRSLRSSCSADDSNSQSSTIGSTNHARHVKRLKVSMTMVNPEHFQNLANNSSGIWTIAQDPTESDILIMDKGNRTFKFLLAMARGLPIVKSSWLETVNKTRQIVNMSEHFYADESFEKRHKFSIIKSIELARKQKLFAGHDFLMTPGIRPDPTEMKAIIRCSGGIVHKDPPSYKENQKLYLISSKNDRKLWHKYRRLNSNVRIISTEGVMSSVMRQTTKPLDCNVLA